MPAKKAKKETKPKKKAPAAKKAAKPKAGAKPAKGAKKMGIKSKELIEKLNGLGYEAKAATSVVPDEAIKKL